MDCYAGSASRVAAAKCEVCRIGEVCPVGTSLDALGRVVFETAGTLQLDGIQAEIFESSKAEIIVAMRQYFYEQGIAIDNGDITLGRSSARRLLGASLMLGDASKRVLSTRLFVDFRIQTSATNSSVPTALGILDAAAVSQLVVDSVQSDGVAAALNMPSTAIFVATVGEPTQGKSVTGACPAGTPCAGTTAAG